MKKVNLVMPGEFTGVESVAIDPATMEPQHKAGLSSLTDADDYLDAPDEVLEHERRIWKGMLPDDIDENHFESLSVVTNGGMGILYAATERDLERDVAMKVIIPARKDEQGIFETFLREAKLTSQLQHPNIMPIYRMGLHPDHGAYYTMRYVRGESLLSILNKINGGNKAYIQKYTYLRMLEIIRSIASAVAYAHSRYIIHRDIKPANIMVGEFGDVLLLDWGLAKQLPGGGRRQIHVDDETPLSTLMGHVLKGSPSYMSPEQAMGADGAIDMRTDVFLLGATLYHIFTGEPPFKGANVRDIVMKARECNFDEADSTRFASAQVPGAVANIIERAMKKNPEHRYQRVSDMVEDIENVVHGNLDFKRGRYKAGDLMIKQGAAADSLYYIVSGEVVVYSEGKAGLVKELERVGPGEIVGELALISDTTRQASVKAVTDTEVLIMDKKVFSQNLEKLPPWMSKLLECLAGRLLTANEHNKDLHLRPKFLPW